MLRRALAAPAALSSGVLGVLAVGLTLQTAGALAGLPDGPCGKPELGKECVAPGEDAEFQGYARQIQAIQEKLAKGLPIERGFHRKAHGCLQGTFSVLSDRPDEAKAGVFAQTRDFPAWVRFSNASGRDQADTAADMRGMAIKIVNASPGQDQDFLMTNGPVHFAKDAKGMMAFAQAEADGALAVGAYLLGNPKGTAVLLKDTSRKVASMATETYWSRVPILVGTEAVKFNATPCASVPPATRPAKPSPTYLTDDLRTRAMQGPICFDFRVQFQRDPEKQPVEDASVEWMESDTPSVRVARLTLPPQTFGSTEQLEACETMAFSPWNALPEHRPLGNMSRARRVVYPSSAEFRKAYGPAPVPTSITTGNPGESRK